MKVCKFGGSSLADAKQVNKVWAILQQDPDRRIVVVSAPGKRHAEDFKITDHLIALANAVTSNYDGSGLIRKIAARYDQIAQDLGLEDDFTTIVEEDLRKRIERWSQSPTALSNTLKAAGEDLSAQLISRYFNSRGRKTSYVSPKELGLCLEPTENGASIIPSSYESIRKVLTRKLERFDLVVVPGFFGYSENFKNIYTFSRGGSDITGSILAAAMDVELYENWTDVDAVYAMSPKINPKAHPIKELTYMEMRELAYAGFSVFHEEALEPLMGRDIPLRIRNTNNPAARGTDILAKRTDYENIVTGIAGSGGFVAIRIARYLMNRKIGFVQKILEVFGRYNVPIEHLPTGIDSITVIVRASVFPPEKRDLVCRDLWAEVEPDEITIEDELAIVMVVGDAMAKTVGVAKRAVTALSNAGINIELMIQESSEISMIFGVEERFCTYAIIELYKAFYS